MYRNNCTVTIDYSVWPSWLPLWPRAQRTLGIMDRAMCLKSRQSTTSVVRGIKYSLDQQQRVLNGRWIMGDVGFIRLWRCIRYNDVPYGVVLWCMVVTCDLYTQNHCCFYLGSRCAIICVSTVQTVIHTGSVWYRGFDHVLSSGRPLKTSLLVARIHV